MATIFSLGRRERKAVRAIGKVGVGTRWSGTLSPKEGSMGRRPIDRSFKARRRPRANRANLHF